jgi:hypothetical protein
MRQTLRIGAIVVVAAAAALFAAQSGADQTFTLAMTDDAREAWEKKLNDTLSVPFAKVDVCQKNASMSIELGKGCVEAASADICCDSWDYDLTCSEKRSWKLKAIQGHTCTQKPRKDE